MKIINYEELEMIRVDVYLSEVLEDVSRAEIQRMIKSEDILVNDKKTKPSYKLELNDVIAVSPIVEEEFEITPIDYPIEVIYEDEDLIVINKPQGLVVYPGAGKEELSVVAALLGAGVNLFETEEKERIGIVHRLDKDTSGLMVLSKSEKAHFELMRMFKEREITRKYYALVDGVIAHEYGTIDAPIGRDRKNRTLMSITSEGREAKTFFRVIEKLKDCTLVEFDLYTGRTHQIRVHSQYIKHSIIGDPIYRKKTKVKSPQLMLQSFYIKINHPCTSEEMEFKLDLRDDFVEIMNGVRS